MAYDRDKMALPEGMSELFRFYANHNQSSSKQKIKVREKKSFNWFINDVFHFQYNYSFT
jgi:hypothetical protein